MPRRVGVLLQFVLLGIRILYQDLWECWTVTHVLKQGFLRNFGHSEKGLEFLTLKFGRTSVNIIFNVSRATELSVVHTVMCYPLEIK